MVFFIPVTTVCFRQPMLLKGNLLEFASPTYPLFNFPRILATPGATLAGVFAGTIPYSELVDIFGNYSGLGYSFLFGLIVGIVSALTADAKLDKRPGQMALLAA